VYSIYLRLIKYFEIKMTISNPLTATMLAPTVFQYCSNNDIMKRISGAKRNLVPNLTKFERQKTKLIKYMPNSNELLPNTTRLAKHEIKNAESINSRNNTSKETFEPVESEHKFHFKFRSTPEVKKTDPSATQLNKKSFQKQNSVIQDQKSAQLLESVIIFHQDSFTGKTNNAWLNTIQRNKLIKEKNLNESSITELHSYLIESSSTFQLNNSSAKKNTFLPPILTSSVTDKSTHFRENSKTAIIEDIILKRKKLIKSVNFNTKLQILNEPYTKSISATKIYSSKINQEPYSEIYSKCNPNLPNFLMNQTLIRERV
jgi:hypothetical protein